jgi:hypothetical protein
VSPRPDLRHEREPDDDEREGGPGAAAHRLVPDEPRPQGDQHRRRELEQQPDPDREPVDSDEVQPLHEREADDAVEREPRGLPPRLDPQPLRRQDRKACGDEQEAPGCAELRPAQRADVAAVERDLRDGAVDREERRRADDHGVAEPRPAVDGDGPFRQCELGHAGDASDPPPLVRAVGSLARWQTGSPSS